MNTSSAGRDLLEQKAAAKIELERREARALQSDYGYYDEEGVLQGGLIAFVRYFWDVLEPSNKFVDGWPLWAMCEHLEAVTRGEITRLLLNVPPGFMKSMLTDVFWPAWEWGPMGLAHYRYLAFSYSAHLTVRDNDRFRNLITSERYQALYPKVELRNETVLKVMNRATGWKLASSVGGVIMGERGDRVIIDDPHNIAEPESEVERASVTRWFREGVPSRLNNLDTGAIVIIKQRLHEDDVSGIALGEDFDYCHLMIPWEFDVDRALDAAGKPFESQIGWHDPRADDGYAADGELAWTDRFSEEAIRALQGVLGPYAYASQYQQSPQPRGGGVFQRDWWVPWEDDKFPHLEFIVASLDGAFTTREENCPSALTVWGVFLNREGKRRIILVDAWRRHLAFSADQRLIEQRPNENHAAWRQRTMHQWGLLEWVHESCTYLHGSRLGAGNTPMNRLLIESKGPGQPAAQELANRYPDLSGIISTINPKGDKLARALRVQPTFTQGLVYAPNKTWSEMVITEMSNFPRGKFDDLTDSATQALNYLREVGLATTDAEEHYATLQTVMHKPRLKPLYPC